MAIEKLLSPAGASTRHIVRLDDGHWSSQHPIFERIDNKLLTCGIHRAISDMRWHEMGEGAYEVWFDNNDNEWKWEPTDG